MMIPIFPKIISKKAVKTYIIALAVVTVMFGGIAMDLKFFVFGLIEVLGFFLASESLTKSWNPLSDESFVRKLFGLALGLRVVWVAFAYFFYISETGVPFEWDAADSQGYHEQAKWLCGSDWGVAFNYWDMSRNGVSDVGYPLYLIVLYRIFGPNIIIARLIKALLGAWTCVLIYRLSKRTFGDSVGKMAAVFCMLMPNLIYYCGLHTKETEMVFCTVMFLERADYLLRSREFSLVNILVPCLFVGILFFFRTVLGVVAVFSVFTSLVFTSDRIVGKGRKVVIGVWWFLAVLVLTGGVIMTEVENYWNLRVSNEVAKREDQSSIASWAKYATSTVMAPMIFTVPFATMVDTGQYNQNMIHGGAFVKNYLSIFVFLALFYALTKRKWKDYSLIGSFLIGYLAVISFSGYANAERFHMPTLPLVMVLAAYGVSQINVRNLKYINYWPFVVLLMEFGWTYFKLGSRGLL